MANMPHSNMVEVKVPDIGGYDDVPVIEMLVAVGDTVSKDQGLVTLESDKATMEVPSSAAGVVKELKVKVGDAVSEGAVVVVLEAPVGAAEAAKPEAPKQEAPKSPAPQVAASAAPAGAAPASGRKADIECAVVVLGAGPGGYSAAFRAADLGMDTVLVERYATLGGIGGTGFTPIINAPEVAILGVSRSATKPVWNGKDFDARLVLPLSLSYDHRVIDGAAAARFTAYLAQVLGDLRRLLL